MGIRKKFISEKLVIGVIFNKEIESDSIRQVLEKNWGNCDFISEIFPFNFTSYYEKEMGDQLNRQFLSFKELRNPEELYRIKLKTNCLEEKYWTGENKRKVNLDPGFLALSRFVLATTKDNAHRIPLKEGIYAELTLRFKNRDFEEFDWTYPDFKSRSQKDILIKIRNIYKNQLRE